MPDNECSIRENFFKKILSDKIALRIVAICCCASLLIITEAVRENAPSIVVNYFKCK